jgi:cytochrome o ubiquinol oxidase subunit 2
MRMAVSRQRRSPSPLNLQKPERGVGMQLRHHLLAFTMKRALASVAPLLFLSGCGTLSSGFLLHPAGPVAHAERHVAVLVGLVLIFVWLPVFLLVPLFAWHYRSANTKAAYRPQWGFSWILEVLIWLPPTGIVVLLAAILIHYTIALDPYRPLAVNDPPLEIQVVALDWKWLFLYPAQHIATVNELVVPAGQTVHFDLTSGTVMQSLLMPRLAGQIYAMDGMRTQLNFRIAQAGTYYGENTQYNGDGFAADKFVIQALAPAAFTKWTSQAQANPAVLDDHGYQELSKQSALKAPQEFGHFRSDLFSRILAQRITPGYLAQHHESGNHG